MTTHRSLRFSASLVPTLLALAGLAACSESRTLDMDAGPGDSGGGLDAGTDTGAPPIDAGVDAPRPDAPADAWMRPDGSLLPPPDSGDPFGDAGPLGPPEWVPIDVLSDGTTCDPLTPCGGDIVGTWDVEGGCIEVPVPMELMRCPGAAIVSSTGRARGRVTFDGTTAVRLAQSEAEVEIFIPGLCAMFVGGCPGIEAELRMQVPDSVCIEETGGDCTCAARVSNTIDDTDGYTIEGNEIVGATSGKRWAYCVDAAAGTMRYEDTSPSGMREPGIIDLGLRE